MMRSVRAIVRWAFIVQLHAEGLSSRAIDMHKSAGEAASHLSDQGPDPIDTSVDLLLGRALKAASLYQVDPSETMIAKPAQLTIPSQARPAAPFRDFKHQRLGGLRATQADRTVNKPAQPDSEIGDVVSEPASQSISDTRIQALEKMLGLEPCSVQQTDQREVAMTLQPYMCKALQWKTARSIDCRPVIVVESVAPGSEAFHLGMRPGMVVKEVIGGSGRTQDEVVSMEKLRGISMRNFKDSMRLARYPITFRMIEGVELGTAEFITPKDERIARSHELRKEIARTVEANRTDIVSMLVLFAILHPAFFVMFNFVFGRDVH